MLKYTEALITFSEIPTEINLCFSISNCSGLCQECHSPELRTDIGKPLKENLMREINARVGITCICFLGEGLLNRNAEKEWKDVVLILRTSYPHLKIALYSGRESVEQWIWESFDYVKIGPYIPKYGPLTNPATNQKLFQIDSATKERKEITNLFWRKIE